MDGQAWDPFTTLASGGSSSALPASSPTDELYLAWFEQADTGAVQVFLSDYQGQWDAS